MTLHSTARAALRKALRVFQSFGVRRKSVRLPRLPIDSMARIIIRAEESTVFEPLIRSPQLVELVSQRQQLELRAGLQISANDYLNSMRLRRLLQGEMAQVFSEVDVILAPTSVGPAPRIDERVAAELRPEDTSAGCTPRSLRGRTGTLIRAGNLAGLPALSLPCGFAWNHLPLGVQLVGRPFDEATLIDLGRAYQEITDWHRHTPPIPCTGERGTLQ